MLPSTDVVSRGYTGITSDNQCPGYIYTVYIQIYIYGIKELKLTLLDISDLLSNRKNIFKAQVREASFLPGTRPANKEHPQIRLRLHNPKPSIPIHACFQSLSPTVAVGDLIWFQSLHRLK